MLSNDLSHDEVIERIQNAFRPLRCVAEIWDYNQKVRFRVFDANDNPAVTFPEEVLSQLRQESTLASLLDAVRTDLERKGYKLDSR